MCSRCGTRPAGALASSAARWRTPKRCCSSTTATARFGKTTGPRSARACRRSAPARRSPGGRGSRGGARRSSSPSAARRVIRPTPGISDWSVAKCCSASVSVGAISAAWPPCSTARSIACSATTVLPEPTSPISSRCIGRSRARSASTSAIAFDLVAGRRERQRLGAPRRASASAARSAARRARRRGARGAGAAGRSGRPAARRTPAGGGRPRGRRSARRPARSPVGQLQALAQRRRQRLDHVVDGVAVLLDERQQLRRGDALGRRILRDLGLFADRRDRVGLGVGVDAEAPLPWYLPASISRVPAGYCADSHGWLKNVAFMMPVPSLTVASTSGFIPRRRTGREVMDLTSTSTVAVSSSASSAIVRASPVARGRWSRRSPTVSRPSDSAAAAAVGGLMSSGLRRRDGPRPAHGRAPQLVGRQLARLGEGERRRQARAVRAVRRGRLAEAASRRRSPATPPPAATTRTAGRRPRARARRRRAPAPRPRRRPAARPRPRCRSPARRRPTAARGRSRSVASRLAPGDELLADVADGVADREAALGVLARGGRDAAGAHGVQRRLHRGRRSRRRRARRSARRRPTGRPAGSATARPHDLVRQLGGALGGHEDVGAVGQHDDLLGGDVVDARRGSPSSRGSASGRRPGRGRRGPRTGPSGRRPWRRPARRRPAGARRRPPRRRRRAPAPLPFDPTALRRASRSTTWACMSATSRRETSPAPAKTPRRLLGLVGVDVDLQRRVVADDEDRVADRLQPRARSARLQAAAGDREVGAVAVGLARVLGVGDARAGA